MKGEGAASLLAQLPRWVSGHFVVRSSLTCQADCQLSGQSARLPAWLSGQCECHSDIQPEYGGASLNVRPVGQAVQTCYVLTAHAHLESCGAGSMISGQGSIPAH